MAPSQQCGDIVLSVCARKGLGFRVVCVCVVRVCVCVALQASRLRISCAHVSACFSFASSGNPCDVDGFGDNR